MQNLVYMKGALVQILENLGNFLSKFCQKQDQVYEWDIFIFWN